MVRPDTWWWWKPQNPWAMTSRTFHGSFGPPFEDEQGAVRGEGHADRVDDLRLGEDGLDAEPFGEEVAFELGVELALIDERDGERQRPGGRLRQGELGGRVRRCGGEPGG